VVCKFVTNSVRARKFTGNVIYHILRLLHRHLISRKDVSNFFPLLSQQNIKTIFDVLLPFCCFASFSFFAALYNEVSMRFLLCVIKNVHLLKRKQSNSFFSHTLWDLGIFFIIFPCLFREICEHMWQIHFIKFLNRLCDG
jgi:hypothetical protein